MRNYLRFCRRYPLAGASALAAVVGFRLLLWVAPFRRLKGQPANPTEVPVRDPGRKHRIIEAVRCAAQLVPQATCLTQALAARWLLRLRGEDAALCLGVDRGESGAFQAHAWLESHGRVILGRLPDLERFRRLAGASLAL